ncbi:MAG: protein phosphatase 2C domain-containing protein [Chitinophagaceae bacterium]
MAETYFGITDKGRQRSNNEDTFIAEPVLQNKYIAACVIDGVGGYEGGEVAATMARKALLDYFSVPSGALLPMMQEAIVSANDKIHAQRALNQELSSMACVLTLAVVDKGNNKFYYAHVGDTRLYLFRDGSLVKLTKDQSFVGFLEDSGRLSEAEAMSHPKRNEINKALGFEAPLLSPSEYIETGESPFLPGDLLLLCSDGLSDLVDRQAMTNLLKDKKTLSEKAKALVDAANDAGGKDNITVVLVHNNAKATKLKSSRQPIAVRKNPAPNPVPVPAPVQSPGSVSARREAPPARPVASPVVASPQKGGSKTAIISLTILTLLSSGIALWLWLQRPHQVKNPGAKIPNANGAQLLSDTLNRFGGDTILLSQDLFGPVVFLSDTLFINKDSLHIAGAGLSVSADGAQQGSVASIVIAPGISYIMFDDLIFKNTNITIDPGNMEALHFKNVLFEGSTVQVAQKYAPLPGRYTGTLQNFKLLSDSLQMINR